MTTRSYHCILGESNLSLSIDATSEVSRISASVVYNLNLPCIFDTSGFQRSSAVIKVPTANGFYTSQMNLTISYDLPSDVLLSSDWILPCQPTFIDDHPFISDPALKITQVFPRPHIWQQIDGLSVYLRLHHSL